jgi:hypothetical protein
MKLTVDVIRREFGVVHGHFRGGMTEKLHQRGKTDPGPEHFRCVRVAKHVGRDSAFDSQHGAHTKEFHA